MSAYVNSVSDKLYLLSYSDHNLLCITSSSGQPKFLGSYTNSDDPEWLKDCHFSEHTLVHCNVPFVLCPQESAAEAGIHFQLSYGNQDFSVKPLDEQILLVYSAHFPSALEKRLVKPKVYLDFEILHQFKSGLSRSNAIFFSVIEEDMMIRTYSGPRIILANRFPVKSKDDIFYFVMFAIEQLKLDISAIHFEFIGSSDHYETYESLFRNYLPKLLHIQNFLIDSSRLSEQQQRLLDKEWLTAVTIQCV